MKDDAEWDQAYARLIEQAQALMEYCDKKRSRAIIVLAAKADPKNIPATYQAMRVSACPRDMTINTVVSFCGKVGIPVEFRDEDSPAGPFGGQAGLVS